MVVSLYICEIPINVTKQDIENLFGDLEGYRETRTKGAQDRRKIAFVDFDSEKEAKFAMNTLQGFKFSEQDRGLILKFSDNSKGGKVQPRSEHDQHRNKSYTGVEGHDDHHDRFSEAYLSSKRARSRSRSSEFSNEHRYNRDRDYSRNKSGGHPTRVGGNNLPKPQQQTPPNYNLGDVLNILKESNQGQQYPNEPDNSANGNNNIQPILDILNNLQAVQLLSQLAGGQPNNQEGNINNNMNTNTIPSNKQAFKQDSFTNSFYKFDDYFKDNVNFKSNSTNIVYVEGLPLDVTEREIAHIFRPFPGFKSARLIVKDKNGEKSIICFADFEDVYQSTICINTLQGYRFDKNDLVGLHFSYGVNKNKK